MVKNFLHDIKGMSLVIVVFAMMVLAVLGWTLAGMVSTGFQSYLSGLDSERALELAEAGIEESIRLIKNNDTAFDQDSDYLYRKLDYGEYNVTRVNATTIINITSTGYVPGMNNYRAMRQVKVMFVGDGGEMNAISGGNLFDWHDASPVAVEGPIVSANFYGNDGNTMPNETTDINVPQSVPGQYERLMAEALIPEIDMGWYFGNATCKYTGDQDWKASDFNGACLKEKNGIIYVNGNLVLNCTNNKLSLTFLSFIVTGDITIKGNKVFSLREHVNTKNNIAYPILATLNGNIITDCTSCADHSFAGMIYTKNGIVNLTNVSTEPGKAMALMGGNVELNGYATVECKKNKASKYINLENGFNTTPTNTILTWHEE